MAFVLPGGSIYQAAVLIIAKEATKQAVIGAASGAVISAGMAMLQGKSGDELIYATINGAADGYLAGAITGVATGGIKVEKLAREAQKMKSVSDVETIFNGKVYDANGKFIEDYVEETYKQSKAIRDAHRIGLDKFTSSKLRTELPGTPGNWNPNLNKTVLEPNTKIKVGENAIYETNNDGLVSKVKATCDGSTVPHARNLYQQKMSVSLKDGLKTDQGGHIIAAQNGGIGEQINYVPMAQKLNQGPYKTFENQIHKLATEGHTIKVEINIGYESGTKRPDWFDIQWWIDGVKQDDKFFLNTNSAY